MTTTILVPGDKDRVNFLAARFETGSSRDTAPMAIFPKIYGLATHSTHFT